MRFKRVITVWLLPWLLVLYSNAQADFIASKTEGCTPCKIKFSVDPSTININTISSIKWYFGFGDTITTINPDTIIFHDAGTYSISMIINDDPTKTSIKIDYIEIHQTQSSVFRYEQFTENNNYQFIPLAAIDDPLATYFYMWRYEPSNSSGNIASDKIVTLATAANAIDTVTLDTGLYSVTLRIENSYGCLSSAVQLVDTRLDLELPNVFFPEVDEVLEIDSHDWNTVLSFKLFNRNGMLVFQQEAPLISWYGTTNTGNDLTTGVYYYILESVSGDPSGKYNQKGFIHLFR